MKKLIVFMLVIVLTSLTAACNQDQETIESYDIVAIRLNPSIDFIIDQDDVVVSIALNNVEAESVVSDYVLIGLTITDAVESYIERLKAVGFLDETTVSVLFVGGSDRLTDTVRTRIDTWLEAHDIPAMSKPITRFNTSLIDAFNADALDQVMTLHEIEDMRYPLLFQHLKNDSVDIEGFHDVVQTPIDELIDQVRPSIDEKLTRFQTEKLERARSINETLQQLTNQRRDARADLPDTERPPAGRNILDESHLESILSEQHTQRLLQARRHIRHMMIIAHHELANQDEDFDTTYIEIASIEIVTNQDNVITDIIAFDDDSHLLINAHDIIGLPFDEAIESLTHYAREIAYFSVDEGPFMINPIAIEDSVIANRIDRELDEQTDTIHLLNVIRMLGVRNDIVDEDYQ